MATKEVPSQTIVFNYVKSCLPIRFVSHQQEPLDLYYIVHDYYEMTEHFILQKCHNEQDYVDVKDDINKDKEYVIVMDESLRAIQIEPKWTDYFHPHYRLRGAVNIPMVSSNFIYRWKFKIHSYQRYMGIGIAIASTGTFGHPKDWETEYFKRQEETICLGNFGRLGAEYFNSGYATNSIVQMEINMSDENNIIVWYSIDEEKRHKKEIKRRDYHQNMHMVIEYNYGGIFSIEMLDYQCVYVVPSKSSVKPIQRLQQNVPHNYQCFKCKKVGEHWITQCQFN